jgi:hypothetical protein
MRHLALHLLVLAVCAPSWGAEQGVFSVDDHGAKPGGDSSVALQATIDAAQAYTAADPGASATVLLPQNNFTVTRPIYIDGNRITVAGRGVGSRLGAIDYYGGPLLAMGVRRLTPAEAAFHRVPTSHLDASAGPGRKALATRGTHALLVGQSQIGLGGAPPGKSGASCDYWQGGKYTIEFLLAKPAGAKWVHTFGILGAASFNMSNGDPLFWRKTETGFNVLATYADGTNVEILFSTPGLPQGAEDKGPWRVCLQIDNTAGTAYAWVNNKAAVTKSTPPMKPGLLLREPTGGTPFTIGSVIGAGPANMAQVTNLVCEGYMMSRGLKYLQGKPTQARVDGTRVDDAGRYFVPTVGEVQTAAYLPLNDPPKTHVAVQTNGTRNVGFWTSGLNFEKASEALALENLSLRSGEQAAVQVGMSWGLRFDRVTTHTGSLAGIASLGYGCTYPVTISRCTLSGNEAAYFGFHQLISARDNSFHFTGRQGLLLLGGNVSMEDTFFAFSAPYTQAYIRLLNANGYGALYSFRRTLIDDELSHPRDALIHVQQAAACYTRLVVDGLDASANGPRGSVWLEGYGTDRQQGWYAAKVDLRSIGVMNLQVGPGLRVDGPGWFGTFDASELHAGEVTAGNGLSEIRVTPPAFRTTEKK